MTRKTRAKRILYTVRGAIGQPEAGGYSSDGHYAVQGGFWVAEGENDHITESRCDRLRAAGFFETASCRIDS